MKYSTALAVVLISAAVIAFQLVIMQVLSISQWHHFAYMVISMAMLGFGAAGTVLALWRPFFRRHYRRVLPLLFIGAGLSMAATVRLAGVFGDFDAFRLFFEFQQVGLLVFSYLAYCLPFFFSGLAITLIFYQEVRHIGFLYLANLIGSGLGAALIILLFWGIHPAILPGVLSLFVFAGAWLVRVPGWRFKAVWAVALLVPLHSLLSPAAPAPSEYKAIQESLRLPGAEIVYRSVSPHGTLEVTEAEAQRFAPGLSLTFIGEPPVRKIVYNNGEYFGTLLGCGMVQEEEHVLDYSPRSLPYSFREVENLLVLNAATGVDVSHGLAQGVKQITAVEPHKDANRLLTREHPEWIDGLYQDPRVQLESSTARAYLSRRREVGYDLIVLPVLGRFGGSAGVYAMQEQYHLTMEAFTAMWESLNEDGMMLAAAWMNYPLRAPLKLTASWRRLLEKQGISEPEKHLIAVRGWGNAAFVLSKSPVTQEERQSIREFARSLNFDPLLLEGVEPEERQRFNRVEDDAVFDYFDAAAYGDVDRLIKDYTFNIAPAVDNRPFFSNFLSWESVPELRRHYGDGQLPYMELGLVLAGVTCIQIFVTAFILIILPLFRIGWQGTRRRWTFLYFSGTGIGFMFFEMALIQKLVLYLGLPVYATAAALAILLILAGVGSGLSARFGFSRGRMFRLAMLISGLILLYAFLLMPWLSFSMHWPWLVKAVLMVAMTAPPAFFMGMMFPLGLRCLSMDNESQIPWAAGIDSCLSVAAAAFAVLLALEAGFMAVMFISALAYAMVGAATLKIGQPDLC